MDYQQVGNDTFDDFNDTSDLFYPNAPTWGTNTVTYINRARNPASSPWRTLWENGRVEIPLYSAIFLLAVVGNALVILTLARNSRMRTNTNVFLLNLAVSDLILAVLCMPFTLIGTLLRDFVFGEWMCRLVPFLQATSVTVSVWTMVALSIERYYAICHPLSSRRWQTLSHAYHLIGVVWTGGVIAMLPILITTELQPTNKGHNKCRERWPSDKYERFYNIFLDVLLLVIPLVALGATYYLIGVTLWRDMPATPGIFDRNPSPVQSKSLSEGGTTEVIPCRCRSRSSDSFEQRSLSGGSCQRSDTDVVELRDLRYSRAVETSRNYNQQDAYDRRLEQRGLCVELSGYNSTRTRSRKLDSETGEVSPVARRYKSMRLRASPTPSSMPPPMARSSTTRSRLTGKMSPDTIGLRRTNNERSLNNKKRVIKMLFVVVLEFFVCWTPLYVINTLALFWPQLIYQTVGYKTISFCHLLAYTSGCCNPITYCFMNRGFRNSFLRVFKSCRN